jgi:hypothetical protein
MTTIDTRDRGTLAATLDEFLMPQQAELTRQVGKAVAAAPQQQSRSRKNLSRLTTAVRKTVAAEALHEVRQVVGDDLVDLLVAGITRHSALHEAARATIGGGPPARVALARHVVHSTHTVDVKVISPAFRIDLPFDIDVAFDVLHAEGIVEDGRLRELRIPDPSVTGTVEVRDREVYRQVGTLRAGRTITLGTRVPILSAQEEQALREGRAT